MARPFFVGRRLKSLNTLLEGGMTVIIRHHHDGRVYVIEVPPGSRLRRSEAAGESVIFVPREGGGEVPVFEEPGSLMIQMSRAGRYGLRLLAIEERAES